MLEDDAEIMDRLQQIERILREVQSRIPDLEGLAVVTRDGLPIASALYTSTDEDRISAMTAASCGPATRSTNVSARRSAPWAASWPGRRPSAAKSPLN